MIRVLLAVVGGLLVLEGGARVLFPGHSEPNWHLVETMRAFEFHPDPIGPDVGLTVAEPKLIIRGPGFTHNVILPQDLEAAGDRVFVLGESAAWGALFPARFSLSSVL